MNIFTSNPDFYPTPVDVIEKMMMDEDVTGKVVLEPSAGKGDIVDWLKSHGAADVIACENNPYNLRLLRGKCSIVAEDFLTVTSEQVSHVDYIVMNPPFSKGAEHILHAYDIAPAGCTIVALCNSATMDRYTRDRTRLRLHEHVDMYGSSENLGSCFHGAERQTDVEVTLVKLYKQGEGDSEFDGYFLSAVDDDDAGGREGLMKYSFVRDIVHRYVSAVKLFDGVMAASKEINDVANFYDFRTVRDEKTGEERQERQDYGCPPIVFGAQRKGEHPEAVSRQTYKKELQKHYWRIIFRKLNMEKYATKGLREQINRFVEKQQHVPFTMGNIYRVVDMVVQTNGQRMLKAICEAFDKICSLSAENSTAGEKWKTNANYMVNRRFIVDWMTRNDFSWEKEKLTVRYRGSGNVDVLDDVHKALCFITGTDFDSTETLDRSVSRQHPAWGEWFEWGFFRCRGYKKGTMHFEFLDEDVWFKFNYEAARGKGWDLPKKTERKPKAKAPASDKKTDTTSDNDDSSAASELLRQALLSGLREAA